MDWTGRTGLDWNGMEGMKELENERTNERINK